MEQAFEEAEPGTKFVITQYRDRTQNLRTQLQRIIVKAGLKPWGKLWQNLRSTRETELMEDFPAHVVCEWIGNSQAVAQKHYLQITDQHFKKALQETQQHASELQRKEPYTVNTGQKESPDLQGFADVCDLMHYTETPRFTPSAEYPKSETFGNSGTGRWLANSLTRMVAPNSIDTLSKLDQSG